MRDLISATCCDVGEKRIGEEPTVRESLERQKTGLEARLAKVNAGIEALEKNPELAKFMETVTTAVRA